MRTIGRWSVWAIVLFIAYEVLEDSPVLDELVAGGIIAAFAALIVTWLYVITETRYAPRWLDLVRLGDLPVKIARETLVVGAAILRSFVDSRALKGSVEHIPMEFGELKSPYAATRRALVTYGISIAPNTIVCVVDRRGLFVHRLVGRTRRPSERRWPL